jgi:acetylornithine deacetylase/succinyl-diaminopimelate desuccinylase-like protein
MATVTHEARRVLEAIDREFLATLALEMGGIVSPAGYEASASEYVARWLVREGFETFEQPVLPGRTNIVGLLRGDGTGKSLIYNAHLDTAYGSVDDLWGIGPSSERFTRAWREGDTLYGHGLVNAKACIAAFLVAGKAIKDCGVKLAGDLILAPTIGEIGMAPVDEFSGPQFEGKGLGAEYLVTHGFQADFGLICETTNFMVSWAQPGDAFFKITVEGRPIYTVYINRPYAIERNPNAVVKAAQIILALEDWAYSYEQKNHYEYAGGTMVPKVAIGAVRGGTPTKPLHTSALCTIYIDVRIPLHRTIIDVKREIQDVVAATGIEAKVDGYLSKRGYEAQGVEPLLESVRTAHAELFGAPPAPADSSYSSMWRDMNIFNAHGIPTATYGPGTGAGTGDVSVGVEDLVKAAQAYALIALDICNRPRR